MPDKHTIGNAMSFVVENRNDFYFVVDRECGVELAPVFDHEVTAQEVAAKVNAVYPFFGSIPTVPLDSPYPRKNILMPRPYPRKVKL